MMRGYLFTLTLIALIDWVFALSCYDCGPLYLPTSQCSKNKGCPNGYCTYYNKTVENRSNINFQCSPVAQLNAPGGSVFSTLNKCVEMRDGNTYYRLKICNDRDLCNAECNSTSQLLNLKHSFALLFVLIAIKGFPLS